MLKITILQLDDNKIEMYGDRLNVFDENRLITTYIVPKTTYPYGTFYYECENQLYWD